MGSPLLTVKDLAERYQTSPSTIRYWRHIGRGPKGVRIGKKVLFDERDVRAWEDSLAALEEAESSRAS